LSAIVNDPSVEMGRKKVLAPLVVYCCGTCVESLRKMAKNSAKIIWFCFMLPVGNNVTNTLTSLSLGKWPWESIEIINDALDRDGGRFL